MLYGILVSFLCGTVIGLNGIVRMIKNSQNFYSQIVSSRVCLYEVGFYLEACLSDYIIRLVNQTYQPDMTEFYL